MSGVLLQYVLPTGFRPPSGATTHRLLVFFLQTKQTAQEKAAPTPAAAASERDKTAST